MRLRWTRLAEQDLEAIEEYVGQDSPAAAVRVVLELMEQAATLLPAHPSIGRPGRVMGARELVVGHLPYIIAYRVRDRNVEILRVLHTSRAWPESL